MCKNAPSATPTAKPDKPIHRYRKNTPTMIPRLYMTGDKAYTKKRWRICVKLEKRFESARKIGERSMIRIAKISCGKAGSCANPGRTRGTIHGASMSMSTLITTITMKKIVNMASEKDLPSSWLRLNESMKNGSNIDADTREPMSAKMKSGTRKAA